MMIKGNELEGSLIKEEIELVKNLVKNLKGIHKPSKNPLSMVVDGSVEEGTVLREYYKELGLEKPVIVACTEQTVIKEDTRANSKLFADVYDIELNHPFIGNGSSATYSEALKYPPLSYDRKFDLVYINPKFGDYSTKWKGKIDSSLRHMGVKGGVVLVALKDPSNFRRDSSDIVDFALRESEIPLIVSSFTVNKEGPKIFVLRK